MSGNKTKSKTLAAGARNQVNAYIKTLVDGSGSQILPRTWAKAVITESGVTAEAKFAEIAGELRGISSTVAKARPNIIGTYPVAAGQTVAAGDVVDVQADGTVGKTITPLANVETVVDQDNVSGIEVLKLSKDRVIICSNPNSECRLYALIDGALGSQLGSNNFFSSNTSNISLARLSDTQFVVGYVYSGGFYLALGVVSGDSISFTGGSGISAGSGVNSASIIVLSESRVFVFLTITGDAGRCLMYSVPSLSHSIFGNLPIKNTLNYGSATLLPDDPSGNKRVCMCFADTGDGSKGKAMIATIDSTNAVTFGDVVTAYSSTVSRTSCCPYGDFVAYAVTYSGYIRVMLLSVNGNILVSETEIVNISACNVQQDISIKTIGNKMVSSYCKDSSGESKVVEFDGENVSTGTAFTFNNAQSTSLSMEIVFDEQILISYSDAGNSNYGTATILEVSGDQIAGGFTDESSQCIALQSGEAGQEVEVIFDGVAELPGAVAGQEITSAGVCGYCPKNGWLWVRPEWDMPFATGSYIGTGNRGPSYRNRIVFPAVPKCFFLQGQGAGGSAGTLGGAFLPYGLESIQFGGYGRCTFSWNGSTVEWWESTDAVNNNGHYQANAANQKYDWVALF